jgi:hypothetical protein
VSTNEFNLEKINRTKSLIREYVVKSSDIAVGQTMYDGGKLETNLLHAIGSGNYENILNYILSL